MQTNTKYEIIEIDNKEVTFDVSNLASSKSLYINATEIGKQFNKRPSNWLKTAETKEYIDAVCRCSNMSNGDLIEVKQGGSYQGTWLHNKLFIAYARWLNPIFAVECDTRIQSILEGNPQPAISEHTLTQILHSNQETTMAIVQMNKNMETMFKTMLDTNNNMVRLKSEVREKLELTNHKLSNLIVNTSSTKESSERTQESVSEIKEVVDKLEVYHRRDTLDAEQIKMIQEVIKQKARQIADEENRYFDDISSTLYVRLKSHFQVDKYHEIKSVSFARALKYIDNITLTREDIGA